MPSKRKKSTSPKWEFPNLSGAKSIALDIETCDPDLKSKGAGVRRDGYMIGIAVGVPEGKQWYLPFNHAEGKQLDEKKVLAWARKELTRPGQPKVGANLLYDLDYLAEAGVPVAGDIHDIQIAEPLIDENRRNKGGYSLDALAEKYLGEHKATTEIDEAVAALGLKGKSVGHIWRLPPALVASYAKADVALPLRIFEEQKARLDAENLNEIFRVESGLVPMILAMRRRGVRINTRKAKAVGNKIRKRLAEVCRELDTLAGMPVRFTAPASVGEAFKRLGLEAPGKTATGADSYRKEFLETCDHPIAQLVIEARRLDKFDGTFIEGAILGSLVGDRVHTTFNQLRSDETGAVSGRFSSTNPGLQNIPVRDEVLGKLMRSIFVPDVGERWGRSDYSQMEYRLLAHYAIGKGADEIRAAYVANASTDFHQLCAERSGLPRDTAKNLNFAAAYGIGIAKVAGTYGMTYDEAKKFLDGYHSDLPFIKNTSNIAMRRASNRGYIRTILNRRRRFDLYEPNDHKLSREKIDSNPVIALSSDRAAVAKAVEAIQKQRKAEGREIPRGGVKRAYAYRALNALLQGGNADITKKAMLDIWKSGVCDVLGAPLLTYHDELDYSVPKTKAGTDAFAHQARLMTEAVKLKVPIYVDSQLGANWGACK